MILIKSSELNLHSPVSLSIKFSKHTLTIEEKKSFLPTSLPMSDASG